MSKTETGNIFGKSDGSRVFDEWSNVVISVWIQSRERVESCGHVNGSGSWDGVGVEVGVGIGVDGDSEDSDCDCITGFCSQFFFFL